MGENGMESSFMNGNGTSDHGDSDLKNGIHDGKSDHRSSSSSKHKHKDKERRKETEEERKIRKEKERKEREERHKKEGRREETEEERRIRKEKEKREREERYKREGKRPETEEERRIRKEKERKEREERHKKEGKREETEEERRIRKEKERKEREDKHKREGKREETEEERKIRKEQERKDREERHKSKSKETEEERRERKERERRERKEKERRDREQSIKEEDGETNGNDSMDCDDDSQDSQASQESMKEEPMDEDSEDEKPIRSSKKRKVDDDEDDEFQPEEDDDEDVPIAKKKRVKKEEPVYKDEDEDYEEQEDVKPAAKSKKKPKPAKKSAKAPPTSAKGPASKRGVKKEESTEVWKWWEETTHKKDDGTKWHFLQHKGPLFAPLYEPLPSHVHFYYEGKRMKLSEETEEVATFYGRMLDHDYTTKEVFNRNFLKDWRKVMTEKEKEILRDLSKCNFSEINAHFKKVSEERKGRSKEERKAEKEKNENIQKEYGFCTIDGHIEKIGNFRIEPPSLFRGRGEHPKQGMLKRRVMPEDVIINCSKDSNIPQPPKGHKWKKVQHDNTVTWLACWTENIQNQIKYVMLNPSSKLKGEKDMAKYEKAKELKKLIHKIRDDYTSDFKSKEMRVRQRAVALYFIDKLALRAGNEKDEDQADTVGCCSLRVEHITLHPEKDGQEYVVEFDFLGKDSIRYNNCMAVEKRVFKNVQLFMENKKPADDLFDRLNTSILNEYLNTLMPGLTAKVFRTYNASFTLQEQLRELTEENDTVPHKMLSYNRANRAVAVLCNHQRAIPKTHEKSMTNLQGKIDAKKEAVAKAEKEFKSAKKSHKTGGSATSKANMDKKKKALERLLEQLNKLETQAVDKEENKTIALGTSKLNYLDPRISVAWCKKFDVPIEKVYNKTQREKFRWAIEMAGPDYEF
ncbi:hypothetical protein TCAL_02156 [Tigriopus californicus]|uniref:DNA topoisomerase I n=1 Tax=Tigriopus californicus TaxID=6832 RepID=A0A553N759_TIGCA|nr:DNA topoisomerase I, mitochondrial-like [Tigriopus californicus]TRY61271.1 hypothetical protein TCAL_02156 [Tigriopus californicus]